MRRSVVIIGLALLCLGNALHAQRARKGRVRGKVITVGDDRVVIERQEGGQMTLEAGWKKVGPRKWVRDPGQVRYFHTLQKGDEIVALWRLDEGTHFSVQQIVAGTVRGRVIMIGETRLVIQPDSGGQMTLEVRSKDVAQEKFHEIKKGDRVAAAWTLGDGHHYHLQRIERIGNLERSASQTARELHALRAEVASLRNEIAELRKLVEKALEEGR